jgi:hypothetical protein
MTGDGSERDSKKENPLRRSTKSERTKSQAKHLVGFLALALLGASSTAAQEAAVESWAQRVTEELCVVKGSADLRTEMYEETPETEAIMELERQARWMLAKRDLKKLGEEIIDEHGLLFLDGDEARALQAALIGPPVGRAARSARLGSWSSTASRWSCPTSGPGVRALMNDYARWTPIGG